MNSIDRALLTTVLVLATCPALGADGIAFVTNLRGDVTVDGAPRPLLMSELAKGQQIAVGKDSQLAVMYVQSGKEYVLKGPGSYGVGEREITSSSGIPPIARETAWRASNEVLVKVAKTSAASIRMRSFVPAKPEVKSWLEFPVQGAVTTLQPTLRWNVQETKPPYDIVIAVAAGEEKFFSTAKVSGTSHRVPTKLQPDTEYTWIVSIPGRELGRAKFRTLTTEALEMAEKRRPSDKAEFSDRLLYALLLQELGALQEAQEAWGRLARERGDLPELASLAK